MRMAIFKIKPEVSLMIRSARIIMNNIEDESSKITKMLVDKNL